MNIIKKDIISSTNDFIKENYQSLDNYTIVTANYQTNGKGRISRTWQSNSGENIIYSILIKDFKNRTDLNLLSLVASTSVHKLLSKYLKNVSIKWPNDILVSNKKICGILLEGKSNNVSSMVVIGIGINVNQISFSPDINELTTSLKKELNKEFDIDLLVKELSINLLNDIETFLNNDNDFINYIRDNLYAKNKTITYMKNDILCEGIIIDIHDDGRLIVEENKKLLYINSGEIKIKR